MEISVQQLEHGVKKISLSGRMDIDGTDKIDLRLSAEAAVEKAYVVLDLSALEFMASVGIGAVVRTAKALRLRGGNMVIAAAKPVVALVLRKTGIDAIIPMLPDLPSALHAVFEPPPKI